MSGVTVVESGKMVCPEMTRDMEDALPCAGAKCMMWRWLPDKWRCRECEAIFPIHENECCPACGELMDLHRTGYCGIGGKPE